MPDSATSGGDGAPDEDLVPIGEAGDTGSDVHGQPGDIVPAKLDLARVQPGAHGEIEHLDGIADPGRAVDRPRWPIEDCEGAVASCLDQQPAEAFHLAPNELIVRSEQLCPSAIAQLGGCNDVCEENRR